MKKILFISFILFAVKSQAQFVYPTESAWMFLSGLYGGNYGNLHISSDGDIDTIKGEAYDFPDSLRVASAGSRYYLTGVLSGGQYDLDWRRPTKADISALTVDQVLYGASDGSIEQSSGLTYSVSGNDNTLTIYNDLPYGGNPTIAQLYINSVTGGSPQNKIWLGSSNSNSILFDGNYDFTLTQSAYSTTSEFSLSGTNGTHFYTRPSLTDIRTSINRSLPLQDFHVLADTIRFEGLDGTGTYLGIDVNGDVTRTTVTGFGDVSKVGTPVNNQIGVWTGDGTIEGEASFTYDATAGLDLANSFDAQWGTTGSGTLITGNLSNASATGRLIDLQHDEVTKFQITYTGSTVIGKTSVDAVHALKAGQLGVGATGDVFQMANSGGNTTTFTVDGKIDLYATEVPANGEILIGDGTDMELATITAGTGITITNAAGSITIANTLVESSGEYTPTATLVTNLDAVTFTNCQWHRTGDYVFGTANLTIDPTASGGIEFTFDLPVASNFAATKNALGGGMGNTTSTGSKGLITANVAGDVLQYNQSSNHTAAVSYTLTFSYKIL